MIGFLLQNPAAEYFDRKLPFASAVCLFRNIYPFDTPLLPVSGHRSVFSMPSAKELSRQLIPLNSVILFCNTACFVIICS